MNRFEFSGLGAPKSVDFPKLITHIVHVNTTKHDPKRGFEFSMSTRDNYPCYLLSSNVAFDIKKTCTPRKKKKQFVLSKPKQITRGGHGIRQYMKVDETKLLTEERFGKKIQL